MYVVGDDFSILTPLDSEPSVSGAEQLARLKLTTSTSTTNNLNKYPVFILPPILINLSRDLFFEKFMLLTNDGA